HCVFQDNPEWHRFIAPLSVRWAPSFVMSTSFAKAVNRTLECIELAPASGKATILENRSSTEAESCRDIQSSSHPTSHQSRRRRTVTGSLVKIKGASARTKRSPKRKHSEVTASGLAWQETFQ